jgi:hypothetical protein
MSRKRQKGESVEQCETERARLLPVLNCFLCKEAKTQPDKNRQNSRFVQKKIGLF